MNAGTSCSLSVFRSRPRSFKQFPSPGNRLTMSRVSTSSARIPCSCSTVICKVSFRLLWLFWTLFPITAKLSVNWPFWRTQQPAVHIEFGTKIHPALLFPICLTLSGSPTTWLFRCCLILRKEVPVKRYKVPAGTSWLPCCMDFVHCDSAYPSILPSNWDHMPPLNVGFSGTAFV